MASLNRRLCYFFALALISLLWFTLSKELSYKLKRSSRNQASQHVGARNRTKELQEAFDDISNFVIFIGYPRSGHTLISSLLDAHPHVIIANEFDIIGQWREWPLKNQNKYYLFSQLYKNSQKEAQDGARSPSTKHRYSYYVRGQWQGKFRDSIKVMGAKKGGVTTRLLSKQDNVDTLKQIENRIGVPMKFFHVVRNPFDNIATMLLRTMKQRKGAEEKAEAINNTNGLEKQIEKYFTGVETNAALKRMFENNVLEIQSFDVIQDPRFTLHKICEFLELECQSTYLDSCARIVYEDPSKTRFTVVWTKEQKRRVYLKMERYDFLNSYSFDSNRR